MRFISMCILLLLAAFTGSAFAAQALDPTAADPALLDTLRALANAAVHKQPLLAGALSIVLLCGLARRYMPAKYKEGLKGDIIGTAIVFMMSFAGAVAAALADSSSVFSTVVALTALKVGWVAIGGYTVIHVIAKAIQNTTWFQTKAPEWLKLVLRFSTSIFGSDAIKKAEVAGEAAVAADPPKGMAGDDTIEEVE